MPETPDHVFTVNDRKGLPHAYTLRHHPPREGIRIMTAFVQLGFGTASGFDVSKLSSMDSLVADLLRYTTRDGQPLDLPGVFDAAYRANYVEILRALPEVVDTNGFLPLPDGMRSDAMTLVRAILTRSIPGLKRPPSAPSASEPTGSSGDPGSGPTSG